MPKNQSTSTRRARAVAREGEKLTSAPRRLSSPPDARADEPVDCLQFSGVVFQWRGPAPYYFVEVPEQQSLELKERSRDISYYRGMTRVQVRIGVTEWATSLWPRNGRYVVPLKDKVRKSMGIADGDSVTIALTVAVTAREQKPNAARPRADAPDRKRRTERVGTGQATSRTRPQVTHDQLRIVPANEATWSDLHAVFGGLGDPGRCWCQRYKMRPKESWSSVGPVALAARLREQTACGQPESATTTGLIAYVDGEPAGWCAVDPRPANGRLLSHCRVPWTGRTEVKTDDSVWAVTCVVTRTEFRRRGISRALVRAAVDFARQRGARALEGYPHVHALEHFGTPGIFAAAGFVEVSRPTNQRSVMRINF